ncbi:hypothetical protein WMY93_002320 [Mugilogobius chulae]|uniref:Uncharacterized protein n=1 Tax=Mugilogobius chulae TaxID=88201 RepID=A0AAW0PW81_9GOBI
MKNSSTSSNGATVREIEPEDHHIFKISNKTILNPVIPLESVSFGMEGEDAVGEVRESNQGPHIFKDLKIKKIPSGFLWKRELWMEGGAVGEEPLWTRLTSSCVPGLI